MSSSRLSLFQSAQSALSDSRNQEDFLIFQRMNPVDAYAFLHSKIIDGSTRPGCFLIRESRITGLLTIDHIRPETEQPASVRLAYLPSERRWVFAQSTALPTIITKLVDRSAMALNAENFNQAGVKESLFALLDQLGFDRKLAIFAPAHRAASGYEDYNRFGYQNLDDFSLSASRQ